MPLDPVTLAALIQVGGLLAQQGINTFVSNASQEKNEEYYNKYSSPVAIRQQMRNAGMSDAAIGQKITGAGSGTILQASQVQPADFQSAIGNLVEKMQGVRRSEIEEKGQKIDNEIRRLNAKELRYNLAKAPYELGKLKQEYGIQRETFNQLRLTSKYMVKMKELEMRKMLVDLATAREEFQKAINEKDKSAYEAAEARLKQAFLEKYKIPYNETVESPWQFVNLAMKLLGVQFLDDVDLTPIAFDDPEDELNNPIENGALKVEDVGYQDPAIPGN